MNIYTTREIRTTYDVIGTIRGELEPGILEGVLKLLIIQ